MIELCAQLRLVMKLVRKILGGDLKPANQEKGGEQADDPAIA